MDRQKFSLIFFTIWLLLRPYPLDLIGTEIYIRVIIEFSTLFLILYLGNFKKVPKIYFTFLISYIIIFTTGSLLNIYFNKPYNSILDFYEYFKITIIFLFFIFLESNKNIDRSLAQKILKLSIYISVLIVFINMLSFQSDLLNKIFSNIYFQKSYSTFEKLRFRISGTFTNPNHFGLFLVIMSTVVLKSKTILFSNSKRIFILFTLLAGIYFTGSRTSIILILISFLIYYNKFKHVFIIGLISLLGYFYLDFILENLAPRLKKSVDLVLELGPLGIESLRHKYDLSLISFNELMERNLLFGFGPSNQVVEIADNQHFLNLWKGGLLGFILIQIANYKFFRVKELGIIFFAIFFVASFTGNFLESIQIYLSSILIIWLLSQSLLNKKDNT